MLARTRMFFAVVREVVRAASIRRISAAAIKEALRVQDALTRDLKIEYPEICVRGGQPVCVVKFCGTAQFAGFVSPISGELVFEPAGQQWRAHGLRSTYHLNREIDTFDYPLQYVYGPETPYRYARKGGPAKQTPARYPQHVH